MKLPFSKKKETGDDVLDKIEKLEQALQEKKPRFKPKLMGLQVFFKKKKPAEQKLEEEAKVEEKQPKQEEKPRQEETREKGKTSLEKRTPLGRGAFAKRNCQAKILKRKKASFQEEEEEI